jgi:hypothetical protein
MDEEEGIVAHANAFVYMFARGRLLCCLLARQTMRLVISKAWRFDHARRHWRASTRSAQEPAPERDRETWCYSQQSDFPKRVTPQNGRLTMLTVSYAAVKRLLQCHKREPAKTRCMGNSRHLQDARAAAVAKLLSLSWARPWFLGKKSQRCDVGEVIYSPKTPIQ